MATDTGLMGNTDWLEAQTPYDRVEYPTAVFAQTHPERLAVLAQLAGLDPVDPANCRILEIGGGNCMNLIAIAAAYPQCDAHGFDLSSVAIGRGQQTIKAAGLGNVTLTVEDILNAGERYAARSFDYVIAHGVYAWVPPVVREATMNLIGHVLSDRGVAFVSYNTQPGGYLRMIMRDMLQEVIEGTADPREKLEGAVTFLKSYAQAQPGDETVVSALREQAVLMLERPGAVLFHDELGDCFYPQSLRQVVRSAEASGLRHLTDAGRVRHLDGFLTEGDEDVGDPEAHVLRAAQLDDYLAARFFRQTAFVRSEQMPDRRIDPNRIAGMMLSTKLRRLENGRFANGDEVVEFLDAELMEAIACVAEISPQRVPVSKIAQTPKQLRALLELFNRWNINLHLAPAPFVAEPGERPETGRLIRAALAQGDRMICSLDHGLMMIDQPEVRALLMAADGTKTMTELSGLDLGIPGDEIPAALAAAARRALLVR
jgi:hypothetical protein